MKTETCHQPLQDSLFLSPGLVSDIISSRYSEESLHSDEAVEKWLKQRCEQASLEAVLSSIDELKGWSRDSLTGNIHHNRGSFFSIVGIHCRHRIDRNELTWDQPVIEQPETGILGIIAKKIRGTLHFCLQAKEEPGNIGGVQLSPTVQATYSNYTGAHGGTPPPFLEQFISPSRGSIIFARMQSEDGGRFLYKSNRNMIVMAGNEIPIELPEGFIWLTLRQISLLLRIDNTINACTRSILSGLVSGGSSSYGRSYNDPAGSKAAGFRSDIWNTLQWLDDRRTVNHILAMRIGLNELQDWGYDEKGCYCHQSRKFFRINGLKILHADREVSSWSQPIIENIAPGLIGLLVRDSPSGAEILMQAKAEPGNRTTVQLGPTVQFTRDNYIDGCGLKKPFLFEEFLYPGGLETVHESRQAEEGARFYREYHLHRILRLRAGSDLQHPEDYRWLPLSHVQLLIHLGEQVNSCARSIISCML